MSLGSFTILFVCFVGSLHSQSATLTQQKSGSGSWNDRSKLVSLGTGSPAYFAYYKLYTDESAITSTLTNARTLSVIYAKYEISRGYMGIGASLCRTINNFNEMYNVGSTTYTLNLNEIVYAAILRLNYHFLSGRVIDPYMGLGAGFRSVNYSVGNTNIPSYAKNPLALEASVGLRCLIESRVGIYAECGFGRALFQGGVSVNFGKR